MKKMITLLLLILFILTGCSFQSKPSKETDVSAVTTEEKAPVAVWESSDNPLQSAPMMVGETLFYMTGDWEQETGWYTNAFIYKQGRGANQAEIIADLKEDRLVIYFVDETEAVYFLYAANDKTGNQFYLKKIDKEGVLIYDVPISGSENSISQEAMQRQGAVTMGQVSRKGEVCLSGEYGNIFLFNKDGQLIFTNKAPWDNKSYNSSRCGLVNAGKEGIYTYHIEKREVSLQKIEFFDGRLLSAITIQLDETLDSFLNLPQNNSDAMQASLKIHNGYDMGILLWDSDFLWKYDISERKLEKLLGWGDSTVNLKGYFIDALGIMKDSSLYVMAHQSYENVSFINIDYKAITEIPEIQTVTMGVVESYGVMRSVVEEMAGNFNRRQKKYKVEVQFYESVYDIHLKLIKGEGSDILCLYDMDIIVLADKGVLENLSPYFAESDKVKESDLLTSIQRAGTIGGKLVCVFPTFQVNGFWVEKGTTQKGGWTPGEYIAMGEKSPDTPLREGNPQYYHNDILKTVIQADMDSYVDWEKKECYFDSNKFIDLVKRVKELKPSNLTDFYDYEARQERFFHKEVLTSEFSMSSIYGNPDIEKNEGIMNGSNFEIAGYPSQNGEPSYELLSLCAYGLNSASEQKEGAWSFLEYLLSEEYQNQLPGFPVRQDAFERHLAMKTYRSIDIKLSDEDREYIRYMVDHAFWSGASRANDISVMIYEELSPVWAGGKTAEDAAAILQNRVTIYLNE